MRSATTSASTLSAVPAAGSATAARQPRFRGRQPSAVIHVAADSLTVPDRQDRGLVAPGDDGEAPVLVRRLVDALLGVAL
jgi:hypothetical protein